jgi:hypothetical protein
MNNAPLIAGHFVNSNDDCHQAVVVTLSNLNGNGNRQTLHHSGDIPRRHNVDMRESDRGKYYTAFLLVGNVPHPQKLRHYNSDP